MPNIKDFVVTQEVGLTCSLAGVSLVRSGWRVILGDSAKQTLPRYAAGKIPYYYRIPKNIGADFAAEHDAIEMIQSLLHRLPTREKFRNSHFGEIISAIYMQEALGLKRLYSKLTLLTAENTNAHKMDAFFVDLSTTPYTYVAVEAKSSIHPTSTAFRGHKNGILKQMIKSLGCYTDIDTRFDFTAIRDNLEEGRFTDQEAKTIRNDLVPPGPDNLVFMGVAAINQTTISQGDDDFILTTKCANNFDYRALVVVDLRRMARQAYDMTAKIQAAAANV